MIIATITDQGTEEDTETASRVTRSVFDNFMRRPSVEDQAIRTIASMANNDLAMMRAGEDEPILCDGAFVFIDRSRVRFLISGCADAWHFEEGKLKHRSLREKAATIGQGLQYEPRMEPVFEIQQVNNAFLVASKTVADTLSDTEIEEILNSSETPDEWMEKIKNKIGSEKQFCAITAFLPVEKPSLLKSLFTHI